MTSVALGLLALFGSILITLLTMFVQKVRGELEACLRDRRQLKQVLQLVVGSIVGLLPQEQKLELLRAVDRALDDNGEAA